MTKYRDGSEDIATTELPDGRFIQTRRVNDWILNLDKLSGDGQDELPYRTSVRLRNNNPLCVKWYRSEGEARVGHEEVVRLAENDPDYPPVPKGPSFFERLKSLFR